MENSKIESFNIPLDPLLQSALGKISSKDEKKAKTSVNSEKESLANERERAELESFKKDVKTRQVLSWILVGISILWLLFCAVTILLIGFGIINFSEKIVITFIVGSLAEVFGLWKISLNYFFGKNKK